MNISPQAHFRAGTTKIPESQLTLDLSSWSKTTSHNWLPHFITWVFRKYHFPNAQSTVVVVQRGGTNHFTPRLPPARKFRIFLLPSDRARVVFADCCSCVGVPPVGVIPSKSRPGKRGCRPITSVVKVDRSSAYPRMYAHVTGSPVTGAPFHCSVLPWARSHCLSPDCMICCLILFWLWLTSTLQTHKFFLQLTTDKSSKTVTKTNYIITNFHHRIFQTLFTIK